MAPVPWLASVPSGGSGSGGGSGGLTVVAVLASQGPINASDSHSQ